MELKAPVIGILRGVDAGFFPEIMDVSFASGLDALEITMNTKDALKIFSDSRQNVPPGKYLGIGTICNLTQAEMAADVGAMFFVSPNLDRAVIEFACAKSIPIIAGAFTPTEIYTAWASGATMVKVFPCHRFGPGYITDLRGPYDHIPLVAVGGVTHENVAGYLKAGATAVGVGDNFFGKKALGEQNARDIGINVKKFLDQCKENI